MKKLALLRIVFGKNLAAMIFEYRAQNSDWERLLKETGEILEKISKELGLDFNLCESFDY
ncbi:MAG: hypothetical protein ACFFCL_12135 [Promethearchaeota archaeon]